MAPVTSVDILDEAASQWVSGSSIDEPRTIVLKDGSVLVLGGRTAAGVTRSVERSR